MSKKIVFGGKPSVKPMNADEWVGSPSVPEEKPSQAREMKRLTFDIPAVLHRRIKSQCAARGVKMADELRGLLERHFPEENR
ncbi:hypothetical protein [Desulfolutivibrio sulfoxidireducens]|uniref:hypothetical protein n=1 Tax=Desulfolutivibrio sulfoxidireducens TaxID=2773299 RepID=UPI00159E37FD|nr:hypothetical protein [Desulfolutivibrio sulfoxidireducens]QLA18196.1 hypothetical protein GD605_18710 [Desulfolutivibrio sulfoxidireducens]